MKTFKVLIVMMLLTGQLSFGTGNETCCPDSPSLELTKMYSPEQLARLQPESRLLIAGLPSLQSLVEHKLKVNPSMSDRLQQETEVLPMHPNCSFADQISFQLNNRLTEQKVSSNELVKF